MISYVMIKNKSQSLWPISEGLYGADQLNEDDMDRFLKGIEPETKKKKNR